MSSKKIKRVKIINIETKIGEIKDKINELKSSLDLQEIISNREIIEKDINDTKKHIKTLTNNMNSETITKLEDNFNLNETNNEINALVDDIWNIETIEEQIKIYNNIKYKIDNSIEFIEKYKLNIIKIE